MVWPDHSGCQIVSVSMLSIRYGGNYDKDFALGGRFMCREEELGSHEQMMMMQLMISLVRVLESPEQLPTWGLGRTFPRGLFMLQNVSKHVLYTNPCTRYWDYIRTQKGQKSLSL